jgi:alpha-tubulin suppressor-like RCC1 family protein
VTKHRDVVIDADPDGRSPRYAEADALALHRVPLHRVLVGPGLSRSTRTLGSIALAVLAVACRDESPLGPPVEVEIDPNAPRTATMMVQDTDTITVPLIDPGAAADAGVRVRWSSSAPEVLELRSTTAQGLSLRDSLVAQMRVQATAHARGTAIVTATVEQEGIEPLAYHDTVTVLERWIQVTAGGGYSCGLTVARDAYCWGGVGGRIMGLGNGSAEGSDRPVPVLGGLKFKSLDAGDNITCGLTDPTGLLYCWGANSWGELGVGSFQPILLPVVSIGGRTYSRVSTRGSVTCAISNAVLFDFDVGETNTFCWGHASWGALGVGDIEPSAAVSCPSNPFDDICVPIQTTGVLSDRFIEPGLVLHSVSVGGKFACGLPEPEPTNNIFDGDVYCWGLNNAGQIGVPPEETEDCGNFPSLPFACYPTARQVPIDSRPERFTLPVSALSAGGAFTCAVTETKAVYCWGQRYGPSSVRVNGPLVDSISVGGRPDDNLNELIDQTHACALTALGEAYCWGNNLAGQLGTGEPEDFQIPTPFHADMQKVAQDTLQFVAISAGETTAEMNGPHTCALSRAGAIYCWGNNAGGESGVPIEPAAIRVAVPTRISEPAP